MLGLSTQLNPHWKAQHDWLGRLTLHPSVWQQNQCGCHFWIRVGQIHWCEDGRPARRSTQGSNNNNLIINK